MTTKFYVVSEEELQARTEAAIELAENPSAENVANYRKASAACRARLVPEWANYFCEVLPNRDHPGETEEIKK